MTEDGDGGFPNGHARFRLREHPEITRVSFSAFPSSVPRLDLRPQPGRQQQQKRRQLHQQQPPRDGRGARGAAAPGPPAPRRGHHHRRDLPAAAADVTGGTGRVARMGKDQGKRLRGPLSPPAGPSGWTDGCCCPAEPLAGMQGDKQRGRLSPCQGAKRSSSPLCQALRTLLGGAGGLGGPAPVAARGSVPSFSSL